MTGKSTILIRTEICTDDISGIAVSEGVLTRVGGKTSHGALCLSTYEQGMHCGMPEAVDRYEEQKMYHWKRRTT